MIRNACTAFFEFYNWCSEARQQPRQKISEAANSAAMKVYTYIQSAFYSLFKSQETGLKKEGDQPRLLEQERPTIASSNLRQRTQNLTNSSPRVRPASAEVAQTVEVAQKKLSREEKLKQEYQKLLSNDVLERPQDYEVARRNPSRNRYSNVLPNEPTRVRSARRPDWYFNANWVSGRIACQGPLPNEIFEFWEMIESNEVKIIVTLSNPIEGGSEKTANYWDILKSDTSSSNEIDNTTITHRHFLDKNIHQFHLENWPDHGVVSPKTLAKFVKMVREKERELQRGRILVHCSAGIGRTGTFLAAYEVYTNNRNTIESDTIFNCAERIRHPSCGRVGMIQTPQQYKLVHDTVDELFSTSHKVEVNSGFSGSGNPIDIGKDSFQKKHAPRLDEKLQKEAPVSNVNPEPAKNVEQSVKELQNMESSVKAPQNVSAVNQVAQDPKIASAYRFIHRLSDMLTMPQAKKIARFCKPPSGEMGNSGMILKAIFEDVTKRDIRKFKSILSNCCVQSYSNEEQDAGFVDFLPEVWGQIMGTEMQLENRFGNILPKRENSAQPAGNANPKPATYVQPSVVRPVFRQEPSPINFLEFRFQLLPRNLTKNQAKYILKSFNCPQGKMETILDSTCGGKANFGSECVSWLFANSCITDKNVFMLNQIVTGNDLFGSDIQEIVAAYHSQNPSSRPNPLYLSQPLPWGSDLNINFQNFKNDLALHLSSAHITCLLEHFKCPIGLQISISQPVNGVKCLDWLCNNGHIASKNVDQLLQVVNTQDVFSQEVRERVSKYDCEVAGGPARRAS